MAGRLTAAADTSRQTAPPSLARAVAQTVARAGTVANGGGAVLTFLLLAGVQASDDVPPDRRVELGVLFVGSAAAGMAVAGRLVARMSRPLMDVLRSGDEIVGGARKALFALPQRCGLVSAAFWLGAVLIFPVHSALRLRNGAAEAANLGVILLLAGLTASAAMFLLVDRGLRSVYALAFTQEPPEAQQGVGVRARLLGIWFVGSAVPMLITGLVALSPDSSTVGRLRRDALPWLVVGVVVGGVLSASTARSLAMPLDALRSATARVRRGDLHADVPVDDATEVGLLQSGFNQMVAGLREREVLRDLLGRHVGPDVARRALERGVQLGGEVVEASVLFIDLVGSTTLATRLAPTEVVGLLNRVFDAVVTTAEEHHGWVNKFEGDAALCIFGPPAGDADHATAALAAARTLRRRLLALQRDLPQLDAGIGVSSGDVVAGNVGSESRFEYTVIGDAVNEAARLTELAKHHAARVLASGAAVASASDAERHVWTRCGDAELRGRPRPTELWTLLEAPTRG